MLPFLKKEKEASSSSPIEKIERTPDNEEDMSMLDAVAQDMLEALERKDSKMLKEALQALVEHIQEEDEIQDKEQA